MLTKETCPTCGSVYEVTKIKLPTRDRDSFDCNVCNTQLASWNGSSIPSYRLIERNENHKS